MSREFIKLDMFGNKLSEKKVEIEIGRKNSVLGGPLIKRGLFLLLASTFLKTELH